MTSSRTLLLLAALLPACADGIDLTPNDVTRIQYLDSSASSLVLPLMAELRDRTAVLRSAVVALALDPIQSNLDAAQEAWRDARAAWNRSEPFHLEEIEAQRYFARMAANPIDPDDVEAEVDGTAVFTEAYVEALGSKHRGFFAIEYLMFDGPGGDGAILALLGGNDRRRDYLAALAITSRSSPRRCTTSGIPTAATCSATSNTPACATGVSTTPRTPSTRSSTG